MGPVVVFVVAVVKVALFAALVQEETLSAVVLLGQVGSH